MTAAEALSVDSGAKTAESLPESRSSAKPPSEPPVSEDGGQSERLSPNERAKASPASRQKAIEAMCYVCQGGGHDAGWKWAIGNCQIEDCPLWRFRPYQHKNGQPPEGVYRGVDE